MRDLERRKAWDREYQKRRRQDPVRGEAMRAADRERRAREAERRNAYNREYRVKHRDRLNAYLRDYYQRNKPKALAYAAEAYQKTKPMEDTDACAICGKPEPTRRGWVRDHDHVNGLRRDLLCHNCNVGLGHFKDDPEALIKAAAYLEYWAAKHAAGDNPLTFVPIKAKVDKPGTE